MSHVWLALAWALLHAGNGLHNAAEWFRKKARHKNPLFNKIGWPTQRNRDR
jgi:hypothetical protein